MMERILVFNSRDEFLFDIKPDAVVSAYLTEEVNGEHCLDIVTQQRLSQSMRLVFQDGTGKWREYVVLGVDELHDSGRSAIGTYHAVWSAQYDLSTVYAEDIEVGGEKPVGPSIAMQHALDGTGRWSVGTVHSSGTATIEMFGNCAWERVGQVVEAYGGEVDATISVGQMKVTGRKLNLPLKVGSTSVTRRFDWARDLASIRRKPQEVPQCSRIIPIGSNDDVNIADLNGGVNWLEDDEAFEVYKVPNGSGGWEHPTRVVKNSDIDDDRVLLAWAQEHIREYTRPVPTYEASVLQYAAAGMDVKGVGLGDVVHVVDRGFDDEGLRVEGRVVKVVENLLNPADADLTVGQLGQGLSSTFQGLESALASVQSKLDTVYPADGKTTTKDYLDWLLEQINVELNATGGYCYLVDGEGFICYDIAVDDPLIGYNSELDKWATQVVQIKGGAIRIANTKKAGFKNINDWDWKTVFVSGHILSDLVTAAKLTSGFIGSASSGNYWNLDTGEFRMASTVTVGGKTVAEIADEAAQSVVPDPMTKEEIFNTLTDNGATQGLYMQDGKLYINGTYIQSGVLMVKDSSGNVLFEADMGKRNVTVAGFQVGPKALYNGPDALNDLTPGIYLGTDGINSVRANKSTNPVLYPRLVIADGQIKGLINGLRIGKIDLIDGSKYYTTPFNPHSSYTQDVASMVLAGSAIDLRAPDLLVSEDAGDSAMSYRGVSYSDTGMYVIKNWGNVGEFSFDLYKLMLKTVNGIVVGFSTLADGFGRGQKLSLDGHSHSISDVTNLQTTLNGKSNTGHTHSGYASSSHSHAWSEITSKPTIPSFTLSNSVLSITT